ncbi:efflux RND transporter periplasmic adaptor subunit [Paraburkholderia sp. USG1]|uniref:efflux RND transporter periplasmic adaptor subunit n=1 Tax=Paraburkholderia sp. USG1 TaxID=2952268 RepID=UPI00285A4CC0|nr:efflux RND transporter periplasmic adaptor subunit [Paraburkholderia sp. USG1]MDR8398305.1 efflux RND transporter periplasmic adaptor subunit [Paraburkholderia sp. USG1]
MSTSVRQDAKPLKPLKPLAFTAIGLAVVIGSLSAWWLTRHAQPPQAAFPPTPVSAVRVEPRSVPDELQAVGSLSAVQEVLLAPDTAGRVTAIRFEAGQVVAQGAPLVQLYDAPEQADRAAAVARADFARLQLARSQELAPTGAESRELLQQRQSEYDAALAAVRQLDARIDQKSIRAPFPGQLGVRRINLGQYLNAGDPIVTLTRLAPLYVNFTVPQQDLPDLQVGGQVRFTIDALPGRDFTSRISTIEPRVDGDTRNVTVQAVVANDDHALSSGMYATIHVVLPDTTNAIVLPSTAIQTSASGDSVVIVRAPDAEGIGKAAFVPVRTGRHIGDKVIVEQGVKPGDVVVTAGQLRIPPDATVKVSPASSAPTAERSGT